MKLTPFLNFIRRYTWAHAVVAGGFALGGAWIARTPGTPWPGILVLAVTALVFGLLTED